MHYCRYEFMSYKIRYLIYLSHKSIVSGVFFLRCIKIRFLSNYLLKNLISNSDLISISIM